MSTHVEDVYDYMPAEPGYSPTVRAFKVSDFEDPVQIGKGKYVDRWKQWWPRCTFSHRDSIIYAATCYKLGGKVVALKVYERSKLSSSKMRAIRREISIMNYVTQKKCVVLLIWQCISNNTQLHPQDSMDHPVSRRHV